MQWIADRLSGNASIVQMVLSLVLIGAATILSILVVGEGSSFLGFLWRLYQDDKRRRKAEEMDRLRRGEF